MAEKTDALAQESDQTKKTKDTSCEHVIEGPNGQSVQF